MAFSNLEIKSSSKFLKIEAGAPQDVRLLQDTPMERRIHGFGATANECDGETCGFCSQGDEPKQRFSVNIYNHTAKRVMVWEFGPGIAKQLKLISQTVEEDQKNILEVDLKVEAEGSGQSKKYKITPRMTMKPVPDGLKLLPLEGSLPF